MIPAYFRVMSGNFDGLCPATVRAIGLSRIPALHEEPVCIDLSRLELVYNIFAYAE